MEQSKFEREVIERLKAIETKLELQDYKGMQEKIDNALNKTKNNEERIDKLEDSQKWLLRVIIGAIVIAALGLLYKL